MFVPFRDYKGNILEAMAKLISDLKKFGYSNHKNLKPDSIKQGYGD